MPRNDDEKEKVEIKKENIVSFSLCQWSAWSVLCCSLSPPHPHALFIPSYPAPSLTLPPAAIPTTAIPFTHTTATSSFSVRVKDPHRTWISHHKNCWESLLFPILSPRSFLPPLSLPVRLAVWLSVRNHSLLSLALLFLSVKRTTHYFSPSSFICLAVWLKNFQLLFLTLLCFYLAVCLSGPLSHFSLSLSICLSVKYLHYSFSPFFLFVCLSVC